MPENRAEAPESAGKPAWLVTEVFSFVHDLPELVLPALIADRRGHHRRSRAHFLRVPSWTAEHSDKNWLGGVRAMSVDPPEQ